MSELTGSIEAAVQAMVYATFLVPVAASLLLGLFYWMVTR